MNLCQAARLSASTARSQPSSRFQLAKFRVTIRLAFISPRRAACPERAKQVEGKARSWRASDGSNVLSERSESKDQPSILHQSGMRNSRCSV